MLGCTLVKVFIADGLGLDFTKAIEVELTSKRAELVMVKVLGDDFRCE